MKHLQKLIVCSMAIFAMASCDDSKVITVENRMIAAEGSFTMENIEISMYVDELYAGSKYIDLLDPIEVSEKIKVPKNITRVRLSCEFSLYNCSIDGTEYILEDYAREVGIAKFLPNYFTGEEKTNIVITDKTKYHQSKID